MSDDTGLWPPIASVLRVMAGWLCAGLGALNLAAAADGPMSVTFLLFHGVLVAGGVVLLGLGRMLPTRAGYAVVAAVAGTGLLLGALPTTARCCLSAAPAAHGYPYPFVGPGLRIAPEYLLADLAFWGCLGLLALVLLTLLDLARPEQRTPVDLSAYRGHAEAYAWTRDRAEENVGGLT